MPESFKSTTITGKLTINETSTTPASGNDGTILISHLTTGGSSSIVFKSASNSGSDYGFIQFDDNRGSGGETSKLTIGIQNDADDDLYLSPTGSIYLSPVLSAQSTKGNINAESNVIVTGTLSATGALSAGSISTSGTLSGGSISTGGALSAGSISTSGTLSGGSISTSGTLSAGSISTSGTLSAGSISTSGTLSAGSISTSGNLSTSGTLSAGSITTGGNINSQSALSSSGSITSGTGYTGKQGTEGVYSNIWNFYWTGDRMETWVDNADVTGRVCDYRIKENIHQTKPVLERLCNINMFDFTYKNISIFKSNGNHMGMYAHELQESFQEYPSLVSGIKDDNDNGDIKIQSIRTDDLTLILMKAIQEQNSEINKLKDSITELKNNIMK